MTQHTIQHTGEPWQANEGEAGGGPEVHGPYSAEQHGGCHMIAVMLDGWTGPEQAEANMDRIVACVNACKGIPTAALEVGMVKKLADAAKACEHTYSNLADADDLTEADNEIWDELLAALRPLFTFRPGDCLSPPKGHKKP